MGFRMEFFRSLQPCLPVRITSSLSQPRDGEGQYGLLVVHLHRIFTVFSTVCHNSSYHALEPRIIDFPSRRVGCAHGNAPKSGAPCYSTRRPSTTYPKTLLQPSTGNFIQATLTLTRFKTSLQVMDTSVDLTSASKCACCGSDASMRCSGCIGAPEYESGDGPNTAYCDRDCQREH